MLSNTKLRLDYLTVPYERIYKHLNIRARAGPIIDMPP